MQEERQAYGRLIGKTAKRYEGGDITQLTVFYHGTAKPLRSVKQGLMYLAPDRPSANLFATNPILNRGGTTPRVLAFEVKPGRVRDISRQVDDAIMEVSDIDLDATVADEAKRARMEGYRYLSFLHPGIGDDYFRAIVSLYPDVDLRRPSREKPPKYERTPEGEQALIPSGPGLSISLGGKIYPVESLEDASRRFRAVIETAGSGGAETPTPFILDESGKRIGYLSYNGRIWAGRPEEWKPGDVPIYDSRVEGRTPRSVASPRFERTPLGEQALIPGAEPRQIPTTPLRAAKPQRPVQDTPLFAEGEQAEQPRLPGVEEERAPLGRAAPATFLGYQEVPNREPLALFNLTEPVGKHPVDSTVTAKTLRDAGLEPPAAPTFEKWKARGVEEGREPYGEPDRVLIDRAKAQYGTTTDWHEAGWIMPDGTMLDLSGRHYAVGYEGGRPLSGQPDYLRRQRNVDHRDGLAKLVGREGDLSDQLKRFAQQSGAIRFMPDVGISLESGQQPTEAQFTSIVRAARQFSDQTLSLDMYDERGNIAGATQLRRPTVQAVRSFLASPRVEETRAPYGAEPTRQVGGPAPTFFSGLQRIVEDKMPAAAPAAMVRNIVKQAKPEEVKWTGVDDWLAERGGQKVTKAEVLDFLRQNEVRVEEVFRGIPETGLSPREVARYRDLAERTGAQLTPEETQELDRLYARLDAKGVFTALATKFSRRDLVLPGAEPGTYRELLLTLPEPMHAEDRAFMAGLRAKYGLHSAQWFFDHPERMDTDDVARLNEMASVVGLRDRTAYRSPHWDEPNVLAHIRFNDRTDADGKRVLFIEEVQSDWHQKGRREGYRTPSVWKIVTHDESAGSLGFNTREAAETYWSENERSFPREEYRLKEYQEAGLGVPPAPFAKTWHELAMKRTLRYAAENGYDKVAWTTGAQQESRYWGHEVIAPAVSRWKDITKPQSLRELSENVLGRELASAMPLEVVDGGMLSVLQHNQIRGAVVSRIPVDVVDILSSHQMSPEEVLRKPDVIFKALPVSSRRTVALGILSAMREAGASIRAKLSGLKTAGTNPELLPTLRASDLSPREIAGLLDPQRLFHLVSDEIPTGATPTGTRAETPPSRQAWIGKGKLGTTELADNLNAHAQIIYGREGLLQQGVQPPPGEGMRGFYDRMLPDFLNKYGKKWGARVGETEIEAGPEAQYPLGRPGRRLSLRVPSLDITPAMRRSVLEEGQALFEAKKEYTFRDDATPEQRQLADAVLREIGDGPRFVPDPGMRERADVGQPAAPLKRGAGVTPLGALVGGELRRTGRISFRGQRVTSVEDLAVIGQVASNPQVESFRIVYVKGSDVLADEVISSRLAGVSSAFLDPLTPEQLQRVRAGITDEKTLPRQMWQMKDRMRRLGANGYWLLHNHPAGTPEPTPADANITDLIQRGVPGFRGHVVIDDRAYGTIRVGANGQMERSVVPAEFASRGQAQALPHPLIGRRLADEADVASLGAELLRGGLRGGVAFYRSGDGRVRAVEDIPYNQLTSPGEQHRLLARMPEYGSQEVAIYLPDARPDVVDAVAGLLRDGVIIDGVIRRADGRYLSLRDLAGPAVTPTMDRARHRIINALVDRQTIRVQEGIPPYGGDPGLLRDLAEYGQEVRRTRPDFDSWSDAMRKEFGERVEPHLRPAWEEMRRGPRAVVEPAVPPPTPPPAARGAAPMPSGRPGVLQDIDAMARELEKMPWKDRLRKTKERVIETQVNRFEPVRRLTGELKKLGERGLAQPSGTIEPIETMEIAKNRTMGQSQLFGGRLEGVITSAVNIGLEDHLNRYLTLAQFDKRIRDLAARPESEVTPEGRTKDGGYVNPRQFDAAKVQAGFSELREQTGERWPELEQLAKRVWTMNRDLLTQARDVGLVSREVYDVIVSRGEDYVPVQVLDYIDEVGAASASPRPFDVRYQDVLRRMEGTERDVRNALASTFDKGMRVIATINRNKAARAVTDLAPSLPGIIDEVPGDQFKVAGDRDVVSAFYDGHRKNFAVPTDIARAMTFLEAEQLGLVGRILMIGKRPLQIGATGANLAFAIPNVIRDIKRAAIYSKYGVNSPADLMTFAADWVRGLAHVYRQDDIYEKFLNSGAAFSTIQKNLTPEAFLSAARGEKPLKDRLNILKAGVETIARLNSILEETTKLATFERGLRTGAPIDQVAYEVANYGGSPNFGRAGSLGMHLNLIWMFYNARLQGTAANLRRIRETPATAGKAALVRLSVLTGIPTLALWAWNQQFDDDDGMEQISDGDRQRYHIILLPETYRSSTGEMRRKYLKIVKEESEQIMSAPLTGFLNYWKGQHPQSVADLAAEVLSAVSPIGVNLVGEPNANNLVRAAASGVLGSANPLLRLPVELGANYHAFYQGPIVPKSLAERVRPTEQVRPTTSPTIAAIAQAMDRLPGAEALGLTSPIKLQHAVASSTGGLGQTTLDATDVLLAAAAKHLDFNLGLGLRPGVPETVPTYERIGRQALVSRFVGTSGGRENRDTERRFYEALDQARSARGSIKLVEKREGREAAQTIKAEERPYVDAREMLEGLAKDLGNIYKRKIETTYYSTAPLHEREQQLKQLAARHQRLLDRFRRRETETSNFTHRRIAP